jgi:ATPase subunit of ABC transporter with duplicated ATPase domains
MICSTFVMQKTISLRNIEYSINEKPILDGVSFSCSEKERLCIFGENGAGKSTLLKILCGNIEADNGRIERQGHIRILYVPQEFDHKYHAMTVEEYIKSEAGDALIKKITDLSELLGFNTDKNKTKLCGSLSGGQQKIVALSVAFAIRPDFILLDEPENHLDIVSRKVLISMLQEFKGGIIFISHDRLIIDSVATKIGEVAGGKMQISEGDYEDYIEMKMKRIGGLQREFDKEAKRIRQLSANISILQQKAFRGKEVSAYRKAKEELESLKQAHKESGRPDDKKTKIRLAQTDEKLYNGKLICRIKEGSFKYQEAKKGTFSNANLEVRSGNKIVLVGRNGSGKSTFLKCLTGELPLSHGEVSWASDVKWAYFDQHSQFNPEQTALEIVKDKLQCLDTDAQSALGAMRFDLARMITPAKNLSGGERMRIRFAITFGKKADFIILDEPTNHIDEVTWEILLHACSISKSSILLVTHDYEFIEAFKPSVFWMIHDHKILERHKELDVLLEEMK